MAEIPYKFYDEQQLSHCKNSDDVDRVLDDLDVTKDDKARTGYLYKFMGTTHQFFLGENDYTDSEAFELAKQQLIAINGF